MRWGDRSSRTFVAVALVGCTLDSAGEGATDPGSSSGDPLGPASASTSGGSAEASADSQGGDDSDGDADGSGSGGDVEVCSDLGVPAQWTENEPISPCGRPNPLGIANADVTAFAQRGQEHALRYPVDVTGILIPERPLRVLIEGDTNNPLRQLMAELLPVFTGVSSVDQIYEQLGLVETPQGDYWGVTVMQTPQGDGLTFSCATCHAGQVFGTPTLGVHNRRSQANNMFVMYKPLFESVTPAAFALGTGASPGETELWRQARENIRYVRSVEPRARGLDTALAHTILSLGTRELDPWATRTEASYQDPRANPLETYPSDVKPATWWLTKYKNKFFSDGSLVSGNPVLGALLVNEFGRGSDLVALDIWIEDNWTLIEEFTTGVFSTEPPDFFDHFAASEFDLESAQRGESLYVDHCARCHGQYDKGWSQPDAASLTIREQLATVQVRYFENTPIHEVGTDPHRARSVEFIQDINDLALSEKYDLVLTPQDGYVPPPLVGVWARWPYLHNNAVPNLCALLTPAAARPSVYLFGKVEQRSRDFDAVCNGYPLSPPPNFQDTFDTTVPGLAASGHDEGILTDAGVERFSATDKQDLIRYLQTL